MIVEDLDAFMADHGEEVLIGGEPYMGIYNGPDENLSITGGVGIQSRQHTVLMITRDVLAAGVARKTQLTIGTTVYEAHNPAAQDDGAFTLIPLTAT
jgi:hypothetical protein